MSERFAGAAPGQAWAQLDDARYDVLWDSFERHFGFRAGVDPSSWPAITEPTPSLTFDLSVISDGPRRGAAFDAINAEVLRAFVWSLSDVPELIALDWQHPAYSFRPAEQALTWQAEWNITRVCCRIR